MAVLRLATQADVPAMLAIYAPYVKETTISWEYTVPDAAEFAARLADKTAHGFAWLVAEDAGTLLGYAYAGRFAARAGYNWTAEVSVYLAQSARGKGIGAQLYTALLSLLKEQGYVSAMALITGNNPASAAFHKALGFAHAASVPNLGYKHSQWLTLDYYQKQLCALPDAPKPPVSLSQLSPQTVREILHNCLPAEKERR